MSRRDECLITNYEEATTWLAEYKHTIIDEQALRVIECFSMADGEIKILQKQISSLESRIAELKSQLIVV